MRIVYIVSRLVQVKESKNLFPTDVGSMLLFVTLLQLETIEKEMTKKSKALENLEDDVRKILIVFCNG